MRPKLRVLVVDDSALMRKLLTEILSSDPMIEVVGTAVDPLIARRKIKSLQPDVITLDIEMPRMNGLAFLERLMRLHPMPVVMIAANTGSGAEKALDAIKLGAVDFIQKPQLDDSSALFSYADEIIEKVKAAGAVDVVRKDTVREQTLRRAHSGSTFRGTTGGDDALILIGASTGGTEAIATIFRQLPARMPPIIVVQHIPPVFSTSFAARLDADSRLEVLEAEPDMHLHPGRAVVAPGGFHLLVRNRSGGLFCELSSDHKVNHHRPSVDVTFRSALELRVRRIACLLTGMGSDGALGLEQLRAQGAATIAQDERTSVIWGMPGAAVKRGCVDHVEPLDKIVERILRLLDEEDPERARSSVTMGRAT